MASFTGTYKDELIATANAIAAPGKGILAADESTGTIGKRFAPINVENTQPNRVRSRALLFKTKGLGQYISGAIPYAETLFDTATCGTPMVELLKKEGIGAVGDERRQTLPFRALLRRNDDEAWGPRDGLERMLFTTLANVLTAVGYALILTACYTLLGRPVNGQTGVLWGVAGFEVRRCWDLHGTVRALW